MPTGLAACLRRSLRLHRSPVFSGSKQPMDRPTPSVLILLLTMTASCIIADDPPPAPDTNDSDGPSELDICALAIAAVSESCDPPTTPLVELAGGGSEYSIVDDPAAGAGVAVLGGFLIDANAQASADFYGRIIVNNSVCQVACIYECLAHDKDLCSVAEAPGVSPSCFLCSDEITEEGCALIIDACMAEPLPEADGTTSGADGSTSSAPGETSSTNADSTGTGSADASTSGSTGS